MTAADLIHDLTHPWTDVLSPKDTGKDIYTPVDFPPLLDMLSAAIASSVGVASPGRALDAERSLLNLEAYGLREHIDGTVKAWWQEMTKSTAPKDLKQALDKLAGILDSLHASNQIPASQFDHISRMMRGWREKIWHIFDPPVVKDLLGACPNCDQWRVEDTSGSSSALMAYYWRGVDPRAQCRACGEQWIGEQQLLSLGRVIGAEMDIDTLTEMGLKMAG